MTFQLICFVLGLVVILLVAFLPSKSKTTAVSTSDSPKLPTHPKLYSIDDTKSIALGAVLYMDEADYTISVAEYDFKLTPVNFNTIKTLLNSYYIRLANNDCIFFNAITTIDRSGQNWLVSVPGYCFKVDAAEIPAFQTAYLNFLNR